MKSKISYRDNSTKFASKQEINRIVESFSRRISDFEQNTGADLSYRITLNPDNDELRDSYAIKNDEIYLRIDPSFESSIKDFGILRSKLALFRFEKIGINKLLIEISSMPLEGINKESLHIMKTFGDKIFKLRIEKFIGRYNGNVKNDFICLVGNSLSGTQLYGNLLSDTLKMENIDVPLNHLLKNNSLIINTLIHKKNSVIHFRDFDYLFSDLTSSFGGPIRELSMLRNDMLELVTSNRNNIIILSVSSPLIVSSECKHSVNHV